MANLSISNSQLQSILPFLTGNLGGNSGLSLDTGSIFGSGNMARSMIYDGQLSLPKYNYAMQYCQKMANAGFGNMAQVWADVFNMAAMQQGTFNNFGNSSNIGNPLGNNNNLLQLLTLLSMLKQGGLDGLTQADSTSKSVGSGIMKTEDGDKSFVAMDANGSGKVSWDEYLDYYISQVENRLGKAFEDKNSPEYAKYVQEARNMFNALKTQGNPDERFITKEKFTKMLNLMDRLDGTKDGNIDSNIMQRVIDAIKEKGDSAIVSNGKTLRDLIG